MAERAIVKRTDDPAIQHHDLEDLVGYNLKRAYVVVHKGFRKVMGQNGMAPRVFSAMSLVVQFPNISQSKLAKQLGVERSGLVAIVDDLEGRDFVRRTTVPGDRRVHALVATKAGQSFYENAIEAVRLEEQKLLANFSHSDREKLMALLRDIRNLDE